MKKLAILLTSLCFGHAIADTTSLDLTTHQNLTDAEAIELGMTPVRAGMSVDRMLKTNARSFTFKDSHLDLAQIVVVINKSVRSGSNLDGQTIKVYQNGVFLYEFDTSTGTEKLKKTTSGRQYIATTPVGIFRPKRAFLNYESRTFFGANMDYAVFFTGGIATHSTSEGAYAKLGSRASGGCARMRREDAQTLNELLRSTGEGHDKMVDAGIEGLNRKLYIDRVKMPNVSRFNGNSLGYGSRLWTYDAVIIVTQ